MRTQLSASPKSLRLSALDVIDPIGVAFPDVRGKMQ